MVAFLFHVAETKLFQFILWRIPFTFSLVEGLSANSGSRLCDVTVRDISMQGGPQNNFPSWSRIYEIVKVKGSKVLLPVVEPRAEAT